MDKYLPKQSLSNCIMIEFLMGSASINMYKSLYYMHYISAKIYSYFTIFFLFWLFFVKLIF